MSHYTQLTLDQRYQIQECRSFNNQFKLATIAARVGVSVSTISRELRRNMSGRGYQAKYAHRQATERRLGKAISRMTVQNWLFVERRIRNDWSPEQISLWLKKYGDFTVSHESIYQYLLTDKAQGGTLYTHLRGKNSRRNRYGSYKKRGHIKDRTFIDERPASVEKRLTIGHWELDTVMGKAQRCPLVTLTERKSRFELVAKVSSKNANVVANAIIELLLPYKNKVRTITTDNGKEFAYHKKIAAALDAKIYFAHPYASWERGLNENTNGLLRQYFPRKTDFSTITDAQIEQALYRLNNRPRKCLGMKTPHQVFFKTNQSVALAV